MNCPSLSRLLLMPPMGKLTTTQIATHIIAAKGLIVTDWHLRKAISYKLIQLMRQWEKRG